MCDKAGQEIIEMELQDIEGSRVDPHEIRPESESGEQPDKTKLYMPGTDFIVDFLDRKAKIMKMYTSKRRRDTISLQDKSIFKSTDFFVYRTGPSPEDYGSDPLDYEPGERSTFIIVVLILVLIMVLVSVVAMFAAIYIGFINDLIVRFTILLLIVGSVTSTAAYYGMACYGFGRTLPCNIIFLLMGTFGMILILSVTAVRVAPKILLIAFGITAIIIILCLCLAFTGIDFTGFLMIAVVLIAALVLSSIVLTIVYFILRVRMRILELILAFIFPIVYSLLLVIELQMVLGGGQFEYGEYDYAFAAFTVYTSFVTLFLRIVHLLSLLQEFMED